MHFSVDIKIIASTNTVSPLPDVGRYVEFDVPDEFSDQIDLAGFTQREAQDALNTWTSNAKTRDAAEAQARREKELADQEAAAVKAEKASGRAKSRSAAA